MISKQFWCNSKNDRCNRQCCSLYCYIICSFRGVGRKGCRLVTERKRSYLYFLQEFLIFIAMFHQRTNRKEIGQVSSGPFRIFINYNALGNGSILFHFIAFW